MHRHAHVLYHKLKLKNLCKVNGRTSFIMVSRHIEKAKKTSPLSYQAFEENRCKAILGDNATISWQSIMPLHSVYSRHFLTLLYGDYFQLPSCQNQPHILLSKNPFPQPTYLFLRFLSKVLVFLSTFLCFLDLPLICNH